MFAAVLYLIGAILGFVACFVVPARWNLVGAAVGFIGAGLFVSAMGIGG